MAYEMRENSGSIFKNTRKEKDTDANGTGSALIGGVEYWVNAWTKKDKNGNPWQSLQFKPKNQSAPKKASKPAPDNLDEPF